MALGDPVPGAELYIEHEPNDEPIVHAEPGPDGVPVVTLEKGRYRVGVQLGLAASRRLAAVDLLVAGSGVDHQVSLPIDYQPGRSAALKAPLTVLRRTELRLRVIELQARHPAASALREGLVRRRQRLSDARALRDTLIEALSGHLGAPAAIDGMVAPLRWPPDPGLTTAVTFIVPTADGLLTIRVTIRCWVEGGALHVGIGALRADAEVEVSRLASTLVEAIFGALGSLSAPPADVELCLEVAKPSERRSIPG